MITAISLNPSIDKTVDVEQFEVGGLNRVIASRSTAAGKGINAALTASALGAEAECVGLMFREGASGFEERLARGKVERHFVECAGSVRTNIKVRDVRRSQITEINERGTAVSEEDLNRVTKLILRRAEASDCMILTGSMPPGCPPEYYGQLIGRVQALGCPCILDADGEPLRRGISAKPRWIKPNRFELEKLLGRSLGNLEEIRDAAQSFIRAGVGAVAVSLGEEGAVMTNGREALYAPCVKVDVKSTVGAGDAMVAGLALACVRKCGLEETLRLAVACAAARCALDPTRAVDGALCRQMMEEVRIRRL